MPEPPIAPGRPYPPPPPPEPAVLIQLWNRIRNNPVFVAAYSAFAGAVASAIEDEFAKGQIDWSRAGVEKLLKYAAGLAVVAVAHLYVPAPKTTAPKDEK